jgi:MFS transporter, DHA1 family, multidrug resistance protein
MARLAARGGVPARYGGAVTLAPRRPPQDWRRLVVAFWLAQLVESYGVSQVYALLPAYLRQLGVAEADRIPFVGLFGSLVFVLGLPLVPLWGVWADKISRKVVIVRSSVVLATVLGVASLAREPWQMAIAVMLIGLQLGNTGVMLAGIRDVAPRPRLGLVIGLFGAASPIGFALGPASAGLLIDGLGWSISGVYASSCVLALGVAALVAFGTREVRPEVIPEGSVLRLAFGAVRGVLADPDVRRLFAVYGVVFLANQVSRPYTPVLVEGITGTGPGLAAGIGLVMGLGSLVGALISPAAGAVGDRIGFRPVLVLALATGALASLLMPAAPGLLVLAGASLLLGSAVATTGAMVFSMLATEVPPARRSATLNLVYLPLYIAGIIGPALGGGLAGTVGVAGPFLAGAVVFILGAATIALRGGRRAGAERAVPEDAALR